MTGSFGVFYSFLLSNKKTSKPPELPLSKYAIVTYMLNSYIFGEELAVDLSNKIGDIKYILTCVDDHICRIIF